MPTCTLLHPVTTCPSFQKTHTHTPGSLVGRALVPAATDGPESITDIHHLLPLPPCYGVSYIPPNSYVQVLSLSTPVTVLEIGPLKR